MRVSYDRITSTRPIVQDGSAQNFVQGASLIGQGGSFGRLDLFLLLEKRHQNTRRSRVTAPADLDLLKRVEVSVRSGVGLG